MDKKRQTLTDRNFGPIGFKFNRWQAELEESQTLDDVMSPQFWSAQAHKIMGQEKDKGRGDIIEVRKLSESLFAEFLVTEVGDGFIKLKLLREVEPSNVEIPKDSPLVPRWNVGRRAYDVIRTQDRTVLSGGFQTKETAANWIIDHLKKMAA